MIAEQSAIRALKVSEILAEVSRSGVTTLGESRRGRIEWTIPTAAAYYCSEQEDECGEPHMPATPVPRVVWSHWLSG